VTLGIIKCLAQVSDVLRSLSALFDHCETLRLVVVFDVAFDEDGALRLLMRTKPTESASVTLTGGLEGPRRLRRRQRRRRRGRRGCWWWWWGAKRRPGNYLGPVSPPRRPLFCASRFLRPLVLSLSFFAVSSSPPSFFRPPVCRRFFSLFYSESSWRVKCRRPIVISIVDVPSRW